MDCAASDLEAGFSGAAVPIYRDSRIRGSYNAVIGSPRPFRSVAPPPPPAAGFFYDDFSDEEPQYFLDACFLCKKALSRKDDIFMYRGDTPFCSEECRALQIEMDEAKERKETTTMKQRSSPKKAEKIHVRAAAGTVVTGFSKSNVFCYLPV